MVETMEPPPLPRISPRPKGVAAEGAALIGMLFGGFLALLVLINRDHEDPLAMWLGLALLFCAPGLLAVLALARRPALHLSAGVVAMLVPFTAMSGVALPFLIPAAMSFVAYGRRAGDGRGRLADPVIAALTLFLVIASFVSLIIHPDPYCRTGPNYSLCGSDMVTPIEAALSLAFAVLAIVAPAILASPRRDA
jgi:hypothetical protein